jgi:lipoate-protein ligase B
MKSSLPLLEVRRHSLSSPWTYEKLDQRQREIASQLREGGQGALLVSELAPVITYGRRTPETDLISATDLRSAEIERYSTDRGGLATYHGPGQWVVFPVDRLERLTGDPRGVRRSVESLLEIALEVGLLYDPTAHIRSQAELGVWTERGKFAAVGVHIEGGVLLHGLAVNGIWTPTSFQGLRPCGLDLPVDFLLKGDSETLESEFQKLGNQLIGRALEKFWGIGEISYSSRLTESASEAIS